MILSTHNHRVNLSSDAFIDGFFNYDKNTNIPNELTLKELDFCSLLANRRNYSNLIENKFNF